MTATGGTAKSRTKHHRKKRVRQRIPGQASYPWWIKVIKFLMFFPSVIIRSLGFVVTRRPLVSLSICLLMGISLTGLWGLQSLESFLSTRNIERVILDISDETLRDAITTHVHKRIKDQKNSRHDTKHFLSQLSRDISTIDQLDRCSLHLSLGGVLQIQATAQKPTLLLTDAQGMHFVVSHRLHIIENAKDPKIYKDLPQLITPRIKIAWRPHRGFTGRPSALRNILPPGLNLPWIYRRIQTILRHAEKLPNPFRLKRIFWDNTEGFSLHLDKEPSTGSEETPELLVVNLGKRETKERLGKLIQVFSEGTHPAQDISSIDLDFSQKAIIRMRTSQTSDHSTH